MFDNLIFESEENIFKPRRIEDREDELKEKQLDIVRKFPKGSIIDVYTGDNKVKCKIIKIVLHNDFIIAEIEYENNGFINTNRAIWSWEQEKWKFLYSVEFTDTPDDDETYTLHENKKLLKELGVQKVQEDFLDDLKDMQLNIMLIFKKLKKNPQKLPLICKLASRSNFLSTIFNNKTLDIEYIYLSDFIKYFSQYDESKIMKELNLIIPIISEMKKEILKEEKQNTKKNKVLTNSVNKGFLKEFVKKENGKYYVKSHSGKNLGGPYDNEDEANKRLKQVEYFRNKKNENIQKTKQDGILNKHKKEGVKQKEIQNLTKLLEKYSSKKVIFEDKPVPKLPIKYYHKSKDPNEGITQVEIYDIKKITNTLENLNIEETLEVIMNLDTSKMSNSNKKAAIEKIKVKARPGMKVAGELLHVFAAMAEILEFFHI